MTTIQILNNADKIVSAKLEKMKDAICNGFAFYTYLNKILFKNEQQI